MSNQNNALPSKAHNQPPALVFQYSVSAGDQLSGAVQHIKAEHGDTFSNFTAAKDALAALENTSITDENQSAIIEALANGKNAIKQLEAVRKIYTGALNDMVKRLNEVFKNASNTIITPSGIINAKMTRFADARAAIERERQAAEAEKHRAEAEALREAEAAARAAAERHGIDADSIAQHHSDAASKKEREATRAAKRSNAQQSQLTQVKTQSGVSHSISRVWEFEIIDESLIPREFLKPDEAAIRRAMQSGNREIAGVKFSQKSRSNFR